MQLFINLFDIGSLIKQKELKFKSMYTKKITLFAFVMLSLGKILNAQIEPLPGDAQTIEQINENKFNANDLFTLFNAPTNFVVDVQDDLLYKGTEVRQVQPHGAQLLNDAQNQKWVFLYEGQLRGLPVYRIMNYGFRRFLTVGTTDGSFVTTESFRMVNPGNPDAQLWFIIPTRGSTHVYIKSAASGLCLQSPLNTTREFERYTCRAYIGNLAQKYVLQTAARKLHLDDTKVSTPQLSVLLPVSPKYSDNTLFFGIPGNNVANGANLLVLHNGIAGFNFASVSFTATGAGLYKISIEAGRTGKCFTRYRSTLNPEQDGIILWDCDEAHRIDQEWFIIPSVREENTYIILNKNTGQALTAKDRGTANGTLLIMVDYQDAENQRWVIK